VVGAERQHGDRRVDPRRRAGWTEEDRGDLGNAA
jgi:hypothetical protein